jgi:RNA polymerase sigma factor (sigma-70 family)
MARQFAGSGIPLKDLIMAGNEGLVKALKKFEFKVNPQTGEFHRFSSYAKPWVRGEIINTINTETKGPKAIPLEEFHDAGHELTPEKIVGGRMDTAKLRELMDAALTSVGVDKRTCRLFARLCDLASGEETKETPEVPPSKALEIRREVFEKLRQNKDKPEVKALIDHLVEK